MKKSRGLISFLLSDAIKYSLEEEGLSQIVDKILYFLRHAAEADYVILVIWDIENNMPYLYKYITSKNIELPPAKPGMGPVGACMLKKTPVKGLYENFPGSDNDLKDKIGEVLCLPIIIPIKNLIGALGMGKEKGKSPFGAWADANLKLASNILSIIISLNVFQSLLYREQEIINGLSQLMLAIMKVQSLQERFLKILEIAKKIFEADFAAMGIIKQEVQKIEIVAKLGLEVEKDIKIGEGLLGITALEKKPKLFKSYPSQKIPNGYEKEAEEIGSALASPIFVDNEPLMVIALARKKDKKSYDNTDLYFLSLFQKVFNLIVSLTQYEEEKERLLKLKARTERLEALGTLAGGIAHDFNNILNIIMGYAQLGKESAKDKEAKEFFTLIFEQCKHAAQLTSQILLISREQPQSKRILNLKSLVKSTVKMLKRTFPENIEIIYKDSGLAAYNVIGDPSQFHTLILNLASNAKDAMPEGGKLFINLNKDKDFVILEIKDTGKGIDPSIVDKIFDPFFTTKEVGKGTGLGLSQVYNTVTSMGGTIEVKSTLEKGTRFIIRIPEAEIESFGDEDEKMEAFNHSFKPTVLIVEDNKELLNTIKKMIETLGVKTLSATSAEEAERTFLQHKDKIDILITDILLPKTSGIDLAKKIKSQKEDIKIVLMTGYTTEISKLKNFLEKNKAELLIKPFALSELTETLKKLIQ